MLLSALLIAVVALTAAALAPSRALNLLAGAIGGFDSRTDVAYGSLPRQRLGIYTPRSPAPPGGWPVGGFFFGGPGEQAARRDHPLRRPGLPPPGPAPLPPAYTRSPP